MGLATGSGGAALGIDSPARGISLIELLVTLAVAAALLGLAVPAMSGFIERERSTAAINATIGAVQFARHAAMSLRATVVVCPKPASGSGCGSHDDWHRGVSVFADRNRNRTLDPNDDVLRELPELPSRSRLYWRSFRNRPYLVFEPNGYTEWQNGNFLYCPPSGDPHDARMVVLNPQGRLRQMHDRDGDGIVDDANGRSVSCD
jgi:type IV fimbrial biogenesis protein FimT